MTATICKCGAVKTDENCNRSQSGKYEGRFVTRCRECDRLYAEQKRRKKGIPKMGENRNAPVFLGVYVAERLLSHYFKNVERTKYGFKGYDFKCPKGHLIDAKSACLSGGNDARHPNQQWVFHIRKNTTADDFMFLAFDNREMLNTLHMWLIPAYVVNHYDIVSITNTPESIAKWKKYEKPIDGISSCCNTMKNDH